MSLTKSYRYGSETVLVVEDDAALQGFVSGLLRAWGYEVLVAQTVQDALEIVRGRAQQVHALVADVMMSALRGPALARLLREYEPCAQMTCVFTSGYLRDALVADGILDDAAFFIQKPFTPDGLARQLRAALDSGGIGRH
jgi:two-component system, cell cycle sensor histidine kinase and response regulator CckA